MAKASWRDYFMLILLALIWGSSLLVMKKIVHDIPPITATALRMIIAAITMYIIVALLNQKMKYNLKIWTIIILSAIFGNFLPFTLINWGEQKVASSLAAILLATMPLATIFLAHFFTNDEKLNRNKTIGILLGFIGLIILMDISSLKNLGNDIYRQLAIFCAAICYAINAIITKKIIHLPKIPLATAIMMVSSIIAIPLCFIYEAPLEIYIETQTIWLLLILGIIQTAFATLLMFKIIDNQGASFFAQINFLIPVLGSIIGLLFESEILTTSKYIALTIILVGIAIAGQKIAKKKPRS